MSEQTILADYKAELETALRWKKDGKTSVLASVAGIELAKGRLDIPIDEYINHWQDGITAMEAGADQELYNY
jgi:hypothetical protein